MKLLLLPATIVHNQTLKQQSNNTTSLGVPVGNNCCGIDIPSFKNDLSHGRNSWPSQADEIHRGVTQPTVVEMDAHPISANLFYHLNSSGNIEVKWTWQAVGYSLETEWHEANLLLGIVTS